MGEDLDKLKEKKMKELKSEMQQEKVEEEKKKQLEQQKKQLLRKILTSEARSRLSNLRMARPKFTESIEAQLIQIAQTGRVNLPITDDQLREILKKLQQDNKSIDIERR